MSCNEKAGINGVDIHEFFADKVSVDSCLQEKVKKYIREKYSFVPSMEFKDFIPDEKIYISWEELKESIPERIEAELRKVRECSLEDNGVKE